jgi:hypothetical protein
VREKLGYVETLAGGVVWFANCGAAVIRMSSSEMLRDKSCL